MRRSKVCPLTQVCLANYNRARVAQFLRDSCVLQRCRTHQRERSGRGQQAIGGIDVVFNKDWNAMQRPARSFFFTLAIERIGNRRCVGIDLDDGVYGSFINLCDSRQILFRNRA